MLPFGLLAPDCNVALQHVLFLMQLFSSEVIWFLYWNFRNSNQKRKIAQSWNRLDVFSPLILAFFFFLLEDWFECLEILWYSTSLNAYCIMFGWVWFFIPTWKILSSVGSKQFLITTFVELFVSFPERCDLVKHLKLC